MSTICDNNQYHQYHHHKKPFNDHLEIPPRKLLMLAKKDTLDHHDLQKFRYLPYNDTNDDDDDDSDADPYSSDHFRMYEFKVRRCTRSRSHDWTDCPFAHPGEKARRRDPLKYHYSGSVCPEFRRGGCSHGDNCEFAHGVFECWLHPSRYRTEACKDGKNCKRKVCFFAHTPKQLRILPEVSCNTRNLEMKSLVSPTCSCCLAHHSLTSPTSTLLSPSLSPSPPLSPMKQRKMKLFDSDRLRKLMTYKDAVDELMSSLEAMNFSDHMDTGATKANNLNIPWIDTSCFYYDQQEQFEQFVMSPSTPSPFKATDFYNGDCSSINDNRNVGGLASSQDPDLGWVNELLM